MPVATIPREPTSEDEVLLLRLEFTRTEHGGDPFAFHEGRLEYQVGNGDGNVETAELLWDGALLSDLDAVQKPHPDPLLLQRLGERLRSFLGPAGWLEHEVQIQQAAKQQRRVVLTIRSAAAELYKLPWELITLKGTSQHIAELPTVLLRYEWPGPSAIAERRPAESAPGRILMCWSAAAGAVPAAEHIAAIQTATQRQPDSFVPSRDVIGYASLGKLDQFLDEAQKIGPPITVLHLLCHGAAAGQTVGLALDGEDPSAHTVVDAGRLRQLVSRYARMLRLVVLAACDGGNPGAIGNQLGSVAQALHQAGVENVVASRFPLSVNGSIRLTQALYQELLSAGGSLEQAVLLCRHRLARDADETDWASLLLFARASAAPFQPPRYLLPAKEDARKRGEEAATAATTSRLPHRLLPKTMTVRQLQIVTGAVLGVLLLVAVTTALSSVTLDEGPIMLENGLCLALDQDDFESRREGGTVQQAVCSGNDNQSWHRRGVRVVNHNKLCLEVSLPDYRAKRVGGRIQVGRCSPTMENQQWQNQKKEVRAYNDMCLSIDQNDFTTRNPEGTVEQAACTGYSNQWFFEGPPPQHGRP
jgi:hypothetical protein